MSALWELHDQVVPHAAGLVPAPRRYSVDLGLDRDGLRALALALAPLAIKEGARHRHAAPEVMQQVTRDMATVFGDNPRGMEALALALVKSTTRPAHSDLLRASLLAMGVAALEVLIAGVASQRFLLHPGALNATEKEFSLADLDGFDTLEEARELSIARRIDAMMHGGLDEWNRWFQKHADLDFEDAASDFEFVYESFQRRHVIVHNGGEVSRLYRARLEARGHETPAVGMELVVDEEYLRRAFEEFTVLGLSLGIHSWAKWKADDRSTPQKELNEYVNREAEAARWETVRKLAHLGQEIADSQALRSGFLLDELLARKRLGGPESIADDLAAWDTSALNDVFRLGAAALQDDLDAVFAALPALIESRHIQPAVVREWPVLAEAREDPRWASLPFDHETRSAADLDEDAAEASPN